MHYVIDARLEQHDPQIRVLEAVSGRCRLQWRGSSVYEHLEAGGLCEQDFCCADRRCVQELVRHLFLLSTADAIDASRQGKSAATRCRACRRPQQCQSWAVVNFDRTKL